MLRCLPWYPCIRSAAGSLQGCSRPYAERELEVEVEVEMEREVEMGREQPRRDAIGLGLG